MTYGDVAGQVELSRERSRGAEIATETFRIAVNAVTMGKQIYFLIEILPTKITVEPRSFWS